MAVITLLLKHWSNPNVQNKNGQTVLNLATMKSTMRRINIWRELDLLLEHDADSTVGDNESILPVTNYRNHEEFHPTSVFLLIRSMVVLGGV